MINRDIFKHLENSAFRYMPTFPLYNIREEGDQQIIELALPGYSIHDLKIECDDKELVVSSEFSAEPQKFSVQNFMVKPFSRVFTMTGLRAVKSTFENGILRIVLEQAKKKTSYRLNIESPSAEKYPGILNEESVI